MIRDDKSIALAKKIDHTHLLPLSKEWDIEKICTEAVRYNFYSVCIPPVYVALASNILKNTKIKIGTVIGFPFGYNTSHIKAMEARNAVSRGADEIDVVANTGFLKDGKYDLYLADLVKVIEITPGTVHKIIIEAPLLSKKEITNACSIVCESGAEFIKTSTGFQGQKTKRESVSLIKGIVHENIKIKAAGGIRDSQSFYEMIDAGADRIGTSSSVNIIKEITSKGGETY